LIRANNTRQVLPKTETKKGKWLLLDRAKNKTKKGSETHPSILFLGGP
jgi:hypothetical protein